jgi:hypothetical protein
MRLYRRQGQVSDEGLRLLTVGFYRFVAPAYCVAVLSGFGEPERVWDCGDGVGGRSVRL